MTQRTAANRPAEVAKTSWEGISKKEPSLFRYFTAKSQLIGGYINPSTQQTGLIWEGWWDREEGDLKIRTLGTAPLFPSRKVRKPS
jgi:hypothetical protein